MALSKTASKHKWLPLVPFSFTAILLILFTWQQDVYEWFAFVGNVVLSGGNPYEPLNQLAIDKYGQTGRFGYPPLSLPFFALASLIANHTVLPFHIVLGLESLVAFSLGAFGLLRLVGRLNAAWLWLLNPFVVVVALSWKFLPDVLMVTFLLLAIVSYRRAWLVGLFLGLAMLSKQVVWVFVPLFLWGVYVANLREGGRRPAAQAILSVIAVASGVFFAGLLYYLYPFSFESTSAIYQGLFDPAQGSGNFSLFAPIVGSVVSPLSASIGSLVILAGWMIYAGRRVFLFSARDSPPTEARLVRFLMWSFVPVMILSVRLSEPHFWLIIIGILSLGLGLMRHFETPRVLHLYLAITIATYLFFTAQMGFRHLALGFSPWPTYAEIVVGGLNWWHWLWVFAVISLAFVTWFYVRSYRSGQVSIWDHGVTETERAPSYKRWHSFHGTALLFVMVIAVGITTAELLLWLVGFRII